MKKNNLKSNGYGRFIQKVVISVDRKYIEAAASALCCSNIKNSKNTHSEIIWMRKSTVCGDDETINLEAEILLHEIPRSSWTIIWDRSVY